VISILKIKYNLSFHWELVDCKLLRGRRLRAQVCGVVNIHRAEICCIGSRGIAGEFMSVSQVIFMPIVVFIEKIGPHPTSVPIEANRLLHEVHEGACGTHQSAHKMKWLIRQSGYYWPTMLEDSFKYYKGCHAC
jgi:hypothetical protein